MKKEFTSQDYFYILRLLRLYANGVFRTIDRRFHPQITLLVITIDREHDFFNLSVIPSYSDYDNHLKKELTLEKICRESLDFEKEEAKQKELTHHIAKQLEDQNPDRNYYFSKVAFVDNSAVIVMTDLDKELVNWHKKLERHVGSFVESLITEYKKDLSRFLIQYINNNVTKPVSYSRTIQFAGEWFITILGCSIKDNIYSKLNIISSLNYEGEEGKGKILFTDTKYLTEGGEHPDIEYKIRFGVKVPISLYRAIRKLLELAKSDYYLLSDTKYIYGLGKLKANYDKKREDIFVVKFLKHYTWELYHGDDRLMLVIHEIPALSRERLPIDQFTYELKKTFGSLEDVRVEELYEIVREATRQKKGTLVVISDHALEEAQRLKMQCLIIQPTLMTPELVRTTSGIDGAILVDEKARGHGLGVILDGYASSHGTVTRGARYNSAIRYVETVSMKNSDHHRCMAIVVSEDGMIDIISKNFFQKRERDKDSES
ncbi:MAG: DNA integrity scanning protein DisA nucleotide-binding domain protein [Tissierellales bacterium]|jgi:DNA integrity scanning protein DisA with diadenylate cyclase activity|nr:DNA integrity scanning protein DisA nucleotide-binding domain protein [Tissierellales bacterium]